METVVFIIMLLVSFSFLLKLTWHGWLGRIVIALLAAVFIMAMTDLATGQSKAQISDWLSMPSLMLDISVWLTVDVAFQICFCILAAGQQEGKMRLAYLFTLWFPGLLVFPVLFAFLTEAIFSMHGTDFMLISRMIAGGVLVGVPVLSYCIRQLLPEREIRLELMFMVNLLIAALGIVATVNGRTAAVGSNHVEWMALAGVLALLVAGTIFGLIYHRYRLTKQITKIQ